MLRSQLDSVRGKVRRLSDVPSQLVDHYGYVGLRRVFSLHAVGLADKPKRINLKRLRQKLDRRELDVLYLARLVSMDSRLRETGPRRYVDDRYPERLPTMPKPLAYAILGNDKHLLLF